MGQKNSFTLMKIGGSAGLRRMAVSRFAVLLPTRMLGVFEKIFALASFSSDRRAP
jgi:hypothetical protein